MAKAGTFSYYKELPGWAKGLILVVLLLVIILVIYQGYSAIKKAINVAKAKKSLDTVDTNIKAYQQNGVQPSFSDAQYQSWANALKVAFDGYGTDEPAIQNIIMQMRKDIDVLKLIEAYGVRTVSGTWPQSDFTGDLSSTLADELNTLEIEDMNKNLRQLGISFQF